MDIAHLEWMDALPERDRLFFENLERERLRAEERKP
jgi:hypothetical protein